MTHAFRSFAALAFVLAACGGSQPIPDRPEPAPSASSAAAPAATIVLPKKEAPAETPAENPPLAASDSAVVEVVDPGAEPRKPLRYAFTKKAETLVMDMQMDMTTRLGATATPKVSLPTVRMVMGLSPTDVDSEGTLTVSFDLKKTEVLNDKTLPADARKMFVEEMQKMLGMKGRSVITSRGITKEVTVDVPPGASPTVQEVVENLKGNLKNMANSLPEEAVGKNAKWNVRKTVSAPVTLTHTATYTLVDVGAKSATLDVSIVQSAPAQVMKIGAKLPQGATMMLKKQDGAGKGNVKITLDKLVPTSSMKMTSSSEMDISAEGKHQEIAVDTDITFGVKPGK